MDCSTIAVSLALITIANFATMPDCLSIMLDSMIHTVDNGFSFDGIVSIPEMGLEDFGCRPGLAGSMTAWFVLQYSFYLLDD